MSSVDSQDLSLVAASMIYLLEYANSNGPYTIGSSHFTRENVEAVNRRLSHIRAIYQEDLSSMRVVDRVFSFLFRRKKIIMEDDPVQIGRFRDLIAWDPAFLWGEEEMVKSFDWIWRSRLVTPPCLLRTALPLHTNGVRVEAEGHCVYVHDPMRCFLLCAPEQSWDFEDPTFLRLVGTMVPGIVWYTSIVHLARVLELSGVTVIWIIIPYQLLTVSGLLNRRYIDESSGSQIWTTLDVCRSLTYAMFSGGLVGVDPEDIGWIMPLHLERSHEQSSEDYFEPSLFEMQHVPGCPSSSHDSSWRGACVCGVSSPGNVNYNGSSTRR